MMKLGSFLGSEVQEAAAPLLTRADDAIARLKRIEDLLEAIDAQLRAMKPLLKLLQRLPGFK
jgi:hypothetical protein